MSETRFFSQPMDAVSEIDQLYEDICNGTKKDITYDDVYKVLADKLAITEESLSNSEILENKILHFILSLSPYCCQSLSRDIDMTGKAKWELTYRQASNSDAIYLALDVAFDRFTLHQAEELVSAVNNKYDQVAVVPCVATLGPKTENMAKHQRVLTIRQWNQNYGVMRQLLCPQPTISLHLGKFFKDVLPHITVPRPSYGLGF